MASDGWWNPYVSRDAKEHTAMVVGHQDYHGEENHERGTALRKIDEQAIDDYYMPRDTQEHAETIVAQLVYNGNHDDHRSVGWIWSQRCSAM
jgi:hypothetical protein